MLAIVDSPELTNKQKQEQATLDSLQLDVERAVIDHRKLQLASQKTLDQARIDRQTAAREVERTSKAFTAGALPELDVLRAKDALAKADITVTNAEKDTALERDSLAFESKTKRLALDRQKLLVEDISRQVDELKVRSPVDGQVGQLLVQQRANVAANAPILTVIDLERARNRSADSGSLRARSHDRHAGRGAATTTARTPAKSARYRPRSSTARSPAASASATTSRPACARTSSSRRAS